MLLYFLYLSVTIVFWIYNIRLYLSNEELSYC